VADKYLRALLAGRGQDGRDAPLLNFRGVFDAHEKYTKLDVIEYDGGSFIAIRDNPGTIPGDDGWQVLVKRGNRGPVGETGPRGKKGERGARGEATPTIIA